MAEGKGKPQSAGSMFKKGVAAGTKRLAKSAKGEASRANSEMKNIRAGQKANARKAMKAEYKADKMGAAKKAAAPAKKSAVAAKKTSQGLSRTRPVPTKSGPSAGRAAAVAAGAAGAAGAGYAGGRFAEGVSAARGAAGVRSTAARASSAGGQARIARLNSAAGNAFGRAGIRTGMRMGSAGRRLGK
jgi:hypothetical protein